jgi:predicted nucleic-acid-binding protein
MIGVDTNVLVRYVTRDEPRQAAEAERLLRRCTAEDPAFVNDMVLCEVAWVLAAAYRYGRGAIADVIEAVLRTPSLRVVDPQRCWSALARFREGRADYADCLTGFVNRSYGCRTTATFDRDAAAMPEFELL